MKRMTMGFLLALGLSPLAMSQVADDVRAFRRELIEASKRKDRASLERMLTEDFMFIHSSGSIETKREFLKSAAAASQIAQQSHVHAAADEHVAMYDDHTAVLTTRSTMTVGGNEVSLRTTNVFIKSAAGWQLALAQATPLPVRFGPVAAARATVEQSASSH